jgi:hypothetical protein
MAGATDKKIRASRSPSIAYLITEFYENPPTGSKVVREGHTHKKEGFSRFFSVSPGKRRESALNYAKTASFHILPNSAITYHYLIRRCMSY